jgi:hypothetical protein
MTTQTQHSQRLSLHAGALRGWTRQRGVALAQGLMSATLIGSMSMVGMDWAVKQAAIDRERSQAQALLLINSAAGNYLSRFNDQLVAVKTDGTDALPAECATVSLKVGTSAAVPNLIRSGGCRATLVLTQRSDGTADKTYTVQNALQPTLSELMAMGILDGGVSTVPLLPVTNEVAGPSSSGEAGTTAAPNTYAVVLYPRCIGAGTTGTTAAAPATCKLENKAFTSLVFNTQPFDRGTSSSQNFSHLLGGLGPDGAISGPADTGVTNPALRVNPEGELRSLGRGWTIKNPILQDWSYKDATEKQVSYTRGVDGIAAVRNGYDATTALEYTRRDGSSPPTADWDFNGKNMTNMGKLEIAGSISGKNGTLQVIGNQNVTGNQTVQGNQTVSGNQDVTGNLTVGKAGTGGGSATGVLTALADMIVKGATELQGKLTVMGSALFKGEVTFEQLVRAKDITMTGQLSAGSALVSGDIQAGSLHIGYTTISADGTLLGSLRGWGVNINDSCATGAEYALAQNKNGQLMICTSGRWQQLINRENTVMDAPGAGQACTPNGAAGRLPDGTLAICTNGQWQSAAQGGVSVDGACSVKGAISTAMPAGASDYMDVQKYVMVVCNGSNWVTAAYARPLPQYGTVDRQCGLNNEVALEGRLDTSNPALIACVNGIWSDISALKTTLKTGNWLGAACKPDGAVTLDVNGTGLLVCSNGVWSKTTAPVDLAGDCPTEGAQVTDANGKKWYCIFGNKWADAPGTLDLFREDNYPVTLNRLVQYGGENYYVYSFPGAGLSRAQTYAELTNWLIPDYETKDETDVSTQHRSSSDRPGDAWASRMPPYNYATGYREARNHCQRYQVTLASEYELYSLRQAFGGRPPAWNFDFAGSTGRVWTATRRDECSNWGCTVPWSGGGGNWWDHVSMDLWNGNIHHNWNSDAHAVILKARKSCY